MVVAEIFSPDILIVLVVVAVLFGGAKLPKLARSLGSAKGEFEKGLREGEQASAEADKPVDPPADGAATKPAEPKAIEAGTDQAAEPTGIVSKDETTA